MNRFIDFYCNVWLKLLRFTFVVWNLVLLHCLKLKGIDPNTTLEALQAKMNYGKSELEVEMEKYFYHKSNLFYHPSMSAVVDTQQSPKEELLEEIPKEQLTEFAIRTSSKFYRTKEVIVENVVDISGEPIINDDKLIDDILSSKK